MTELGEILAGGLSPDSTLSAMYEIENVLLLVKELDKKTEYYKELKKYRVQALDDKIHDISAKKDALRQITLNTMRVMAPKEKTLDFPSIGKVTRRSGSDALVVEDEEALLQYLDEQNRKSEVIKTTVVIDRRKLKSVISEYRKAGQPLPGTVLEKGKDTLSVTFDKAKDKAEETDEVSVELSEQLGEQLDGLLV